MFYAICNINLLAFIICEISQTQEGKEKNEMFIYLLIYSAKYTSINKPKQLKKVVLCCNGVAAKFWPTEQNKTTVRLELQVIALDYTEGFVYEQKRFVFTWKMVLLKLDDINLD